MEREPRIEPALKAWLDNVLVPSMVRQYLAAFREVDDNGVSAIPSEGSIPSTPENTQ
jgi:hypothetical protein